MNKYIIRTSILKQSKTTMSFKKFWNLDEILWILIILQYWKVSTIMSSIEILNPRWNSVELVILQNWKFPTIMSSYRNCNSRWNSVELIILQHWKFSLLSSSIEMLNPRWNSVEIDHSSEPEISNHHVFL